jgi:hypothetical protein
MRKTLKAALAAGAVALLGGCAPGMADVSVSPAGCRGPQMGFTHARNNVTLHTLRVQRVQSRYSAGYSYLRADPNSWRQIADGECR